MTLMDAPPVPTPPGDVVGDDMDVLEPYEPTTGPAPQIRGLDRRRLVALVALALVVLLIAVAIVLYAVGPLVHNRDQRRLMDSERQAITLAAHDNQGLYRAALPTQPPVPGTAVGILAIPAIGLQEAVVEGVGPAQTVAGPGHVPGTAGLGQPGNSAVVGRRSAYGGTFGNLGQLRRGDRVVAATTEGQSVYIVRSVRDETLVTRPASAETSSVTPTTLGRRHLTTTTVAGGHGSRHTTTSTPSIAGRRGPGHRELPDPLRAVRPQPGHPRHLGQQPALEHRPGGRRRGSDADQAVHPHDPGVAEHEPARELGRSDGLGLAALGAHRSRGRPNRCRCPVPALHRPDGLPAHYRPVAGPHGAGGRGDEPPAAGMVVSHVDEQTAMPSNLRRRG